MQYARWPVKILRRSPPRRQSTEQSRLSAQRSPCRQRITATVACLHTCIGRAALRQRSSITVSRMICCMRTRSITMLCSLARTKTTMRGTLFCEVRSPLHTFGRKQPAVIKATDFFCAAAAKPCSFAKLRLMRFPSQRCGSLMVWIGRKITILHSAA